MDLYVGNASRQVFDFRFRIPENPKTFTEKIQPGTFRKMSLNFTKADIDAVTEHHAKYGMIPDDEIDHARGFHGTCYSVDKAITRAKLVYLMDRNLGEMVQRGREIRQANAIAQSELVNTALIESGMNARVEAFDMTVQQENTDPSNDIPQLSVGMLVAEPEVAARRRGNRAA